MNLQKTTELLYSIALMEALQQENEDLKKKVDHYKSVSKGLSRKVNKMLLANKSKYEDDIYVRLSKLESKVNKLLNPPPFPVRPNKDNSWG